MRGVAATALATLLAGCVVGPDFHSPAGSEPPGYTRSAVALPPAGSSDLQQHLLPGAPVAGEWWRLFRSPPLDDTVALALKESPTLDTARAVLAEARDAIAVAEAGYYPQLDLGAAASRSAQAPIRTGASRGISNIFNIGPLVTYDLDVFGRTTRLVEQQAALAEVQRYQLAAAYLALTGGAADQAIAIASAREQIRAAAAIVAVDERNLELVRISAESGHAARTDVLSAESQLASDRTLLPPLQQQLSVARHALAVLTGKAPSEWTPPDFDFSVLALPQDLPVRLPSTLVRERPDILAAEAELHAASAAIGVATADLYPRFTLSASWLQEATQIGELFDSASGVWVVAASMTAPLFHGGALEAQRQATVDAFAAQLGLYRQTVLQAFGQVADVLRALEHDALLLDAEEKALAAAAASFDLAQQAYQAGQASFLQVLDAQRLLAQAQLGYAKAKSQRYLDTAALFSAMGGGWQEWREPALRAER